MNAGSDETMIDTLIERHREELLQLFGWMCSDEHMGTWCRRFGFNAEGKTGFAGRDFSHATCRLDIFVYQDSGTESGVLNVWMTGATFPPGNPEEETSNVQTTVTLGRVRELGLHSFLHHCVERGLDDMRIPRADPETRSS